MQKSPSKRFQLLDLNLVKLIGTEGARLLREERVQGRPHRRKCAEEAPGPPAESECPTFQSTSKFVQAKRL
ncbi:hypothetical protein B8W99_10000 [Peribacillus simplex]|nr:hypothetical protein B8W99_10000 [Peribacillus simplex]